jgi:hypothetical protein
MSRAGSIADRPSGLPLVLVLVLVLVLEHFPHRSRSITSRFDRLKALSVSKGRSTSVMTLQKQLQRA